MSRTNQVELNLVLTTKSKEQSSAVPNANPPKNPANRTDSPSAHPLVSNNPSDPSDPYQTLVPDGEYSVSYVSDETGVCFGRKVFFVVFLIQAPIAYHGHAVFRFINAPKHWNGKKRNQKSRSLARSSALWKDFVAITGQLPPTRVFAISDLYKDSQLLAKIGTVEEQVIDGKRIKNPEGTRYSKIDRILRQEAGPHGRRR